MAKKVTTTTASGTAETTTDTIERGVIAFAEQLGTLVGTVQAKTQGWTDREALGKELTRIRDGAAELLEQMNPQALLRSKPARKASKIAKAKTAAAAPKAGAGKKAAPVQSAGRGLVDAPGKRHRQPPPQEKVGKHASDPKVRVMGNPNLKTGRRGGRG